tara:strand:+ start:704 stop:856 length:153 start_codon:yes stop_codon:yes gene_type:complete
VVNFDISFLVVDFLFVNELIALKIEGGFIENDAIFSGWLLNNFKEDFFIF